MSAAAALAAAASTKDCVWIKIGKEPKKFGDALQLYDSCEVIKTKGTGTEAVLTVKSESDGKTQDIVKSKTCGPAPRLRRVPPLRARARTGSRPTPAPPCAFRPQLGR